MQRLPGELLTRIRHVLGLSQVALAEALEVRERTVRRWEHDEHAMTWRAYLRFGELCRRPAIRSRLSAAGIDLDRPAGAS